MKDCTLCPNRSRILSIPYNIIVGLFQTRKTRISIFNIVLLIIFFIIILGHFTIFAIVSFLPFKRKAPCNNTNIFWESHGTQHFRPEHARISNLHPLPKAFVIAGTLSMFQYITSANGKVSKLFNRSAAVASYLLPENLHARFGIWIVSRLEA